MMVFLVTLVWAAWIGAALTRLTLGEFGWFDVATLAVVALFSTLILLRKRD